MDKDIIERLVIVEFLLARVLAISLYANPDKKFLLSSIEKDFLSVLKKSEFSNSVAFSVVERVIRSAKKDMQNQGKINEHILEKDEPFWGQ